MVRPVTRYEAEDGSVWPTEAAAINHEKSLDFIIWYSSNMISSDSPKPYGPVSWPAFVEWLNANIDKVREIIEGPKSTVMPCATYSLLVTAYEAGMATGLQYGRLGSTPSAPPDYHVREWLSSPLPATASGSDTVLQQLGYTSIADE